MNKTKDVVSKSCSLVWYSNTKIIFKIIKLLFALKKLTLKTENGQFLTANNTNNLKRKLEDNDIKSTFSVLKEIIPEWEISDLLEKNI